MGFGDMIFHSPWGKGCTLYRYRMYRYHVHRYGRIATGLCGIAGILDGFLIAHIKDFAHIYVFPINSTISKFQLTLKIALFVPCLNRKSWNK